MDRVIFRTFAIVFGAIFATVGLMAAIAQEAFLLGVDTAHEYFDDWNL